MLKNMSKVFFTLLVLVAIGASPAFAAKDDPLIGKHLFHSYCSLCHGEGGNTVGPLAKKMGTTPADLTQDKYQKMRVDEMVATISSYTAKGSDMPTWSDVLPESNMRSIAVFISRLTLKDIRLKADTRRGWMLFKNSCVACHGPRGKGNGILAKRIKAKAVDLTSVKARKTRNIEEAAKVITEGRGRFMPPWDGIFSDDEIIDIAAYVDSLTKKKRR